MSADTARTCWVVSDGRAGMENQALGLAEAVARQVPLDISIKRLTIDPLFASLPEMFWGDAFSRVKQSRSPDGTLSPLTPPFPDLWIACGRRTIPLSKALKKNGASFVVQTQDPRTGPEQFDLVIPPEHDRLSGENVFPVIGSPNRLTTESLSTEADRLRSHLPAHSRQRIAVLIGGDSKAYRLSDERMKEIIATLTQLHADGNFLMITTSRRTGDANRRILAEALSGDNIFLLDGAPLDGTGNPYFGLLGLADHVLVTEESTNMVTEAAVTGKPVHLLSLEGGNEKFTRFHSTMAERGITRPLSLPLESWDYCPLTETDRAAAEIIRRWSATQK